jgi:quercetin dioxygenase-like cupin family protein
MINEPFLFYKTKMTIRTTTEESGGSYCVIEMEHVPNVGPAMHVHPRGSETFWVIEGTYEFFTETESKILLIGEAFTAPQGVPHRYLVGPKGGRLLVIGPPGIENYFLEVASRLKSGGISLDEEHSIAARYGQDFVGTESHWGHQ